MKETAFVAKNQNSWKALETFNHSGITGLATEDVREFARLFRLASHHLAYAKTHFPHGEVVPYLNRLVGISHNFFYVRDVSSFGEVKNFFAEILPRTVRETYRYHVLAIAFFVFGVFFAAFYVSGDTSRLSEIMPEGMGFAYGETPDLGDGGITWDGSLMSAFFITNNTAVAFNTFALGVFGGIGSIIILVYNGLVVGGLFGFFHAENADLLVAYSLILPHGVPELSAIFLAGGGGLMLGKGFLLPGEYSRRHSLVIHAKKAVKLIPAIIIMLAAAAFIEGFFTPLPISPVFKIAFAALIGMGLIAYFLKGACARR
ncbi:MAG: stage II sporulation protein M [Defluviitaleaceae bacterium]|nr:stage II sporulation protein M [Defluviitaleaceae bacterium]